MNRMAELAREIMLLGEIAREASLVMDLLKRDGAAIVPHLMDTDSNPGQRLRDALEEWSRV